MTTAQHVVPRDALPLGPLLRPPSRQKDLAQLAAAYARSQPVRSVVVVGNRPLPADVRRAAAIDGSDLVVRVNNYHLDTAGAPRGYGTATNVVFFNRWLKRSGGLFDDYSSRLYVLVEPEATLKDPGPRHRQWPKDLGLVHLSNASTTLPLLDQMGCGGPENLVWPTTGSLAAWWAIDSFPDARVTLTGFSLMEPDVYCRPWEYASGAPPATIGPEHRVDQEGLAMRRWLDQGMANYLE